MPDIPTDLIREILRHVPVANLFRFHLVCKSWRTIIDDTSFAKDHITCGIGDGWIAQRKNTGKLLLLPLRHLIHKQNISDCNCDYANMEVCTSCKIELVNATKVKNPFGTGIPRIPMPCCNGLILISSAKTNLAWVVWNPFTGESLKLSFCDEFPKCTTSFEPYSGSGIGYDEFSDDYKVVRIVKAHTTFICSITSNAWRRIDDFPHDFIGPHTMYGAFAYGALHWIAFTADNRGWIVALDLKTETYGKIPLPQEPGLALNLNNLNLVGLSGCLFLTMWQYMKPFLVWKKEDHECNMWTKMMSLEKENVCTSKLSLIAYLDKESRVLLWSRKRSKLLWYDLENKLVRQVYMRVNRDADYKYSDTYTSQVIWASLVRLDGKSSKNKTNRVPERETVGLEVLHGAPMQLATVE